MVGQDAVATAEAFRDGVGITGVVLSKLDGDARGGAALSVREVTGQPIMFASTGEKLEDFDVFHPDRMASRILGMGDVLTLIEQAESAFDEEQKERMTAKLIGGETFTLEDFLEQMTALRRMGPIANMLAMMPGMNQYKDAAGRGRRQALRQDRRDHPGYDPGRAGEPEDPQRFASGPHRQRLRRHRDGRQPAAEPVRRGAEADEADGRHDGPARYAPQGDQVAEEQAQGCEGGRHRTGPALPAAYGRNAALAARARSVRVGGRRGGPAARVQAPEARLQQARQARRQGRQARRDPTVVYEQWAWRCICAGWSFPPTRFGTCGWSATGSRSSRSAGRETLTDRGFILPGLVDAHCHIGIRPGGDPIEAVDEARDLAAVDRAAGVLAIRDAGSPFPYPELDDDPEMPRLVRCGPACGAGTALPP